MLQGIFDVLTSIGEFFSSVIDAVVGFIDDLVQFAISLGETIGQISTVLGGFPAFFLTGIVMLIGIMIVLRVVGRD